MPIVWRDQMSVGNALIDNDHRYLLCLVNTVELALRLEENTDLLEVALDQLLQYTRDHFGREEALQVKIQYPGYPAHKAEHQALLEKLLGLQRQLAAAGGEGAAGVDPMRLSDLLRHWVLDHVLKTDMQMRAYLVRYPPTYA
jgi:hemerythrin